MHKRKVATISFMLNVNMSVPPQSLMLVIFCFCLIFVEQVCAVGLREFLKWKQIDFIDPSLTTTDFLFPENSPDGNIQLNYVAGNSVPMGISHYKNLLFITIPRRRPGIPATLNYISMAKAKASTSPSLTGYPNYKINSLNMPLRSDSEQLVSVYRTYVDYACDRLWFIDTGVLEYPGNRTNVQRPSIWVIDLKTNQKIRRYEIPQSIVEVGQGMASITIDVESSNCDNAFAYIPDLLHYKIYVYSYADNRMWSFGNNYFSFDPRWGDFDVGGQKYQWNDGIFSITLGNKHPDGYRTAYFHAMASLSEYAVSTRTLKNETKTIDQHSYEEFNLLGCRGANSQSNRHVFDPATGIIFYNEIEKDGVGCWNSNKPFSAENHGTVQRNEQTMIYPSDITIDSEGVIWVMTNSIPIFIYSQLDPNEYNFRVWKQDAVKAAEGTVCQL